jgi:hypothetical protein
LPFLSGGVDLPKHNLNAEAIRDMSWGMVFTSSTGGIGTVCATKDASKEVSDVVLIRAGVVDKPTSTAVVSRKGISCP